MGTRSGDVDPGLHAFLARQVGMSIDDIDTLLNKKSGMLGLSGVTDFRDLLTGYRRFRTTGYRAQHERWEELSQGQIPKVMVIACSDSRVDPAQIFDTSPGEIFVVRNVANIVPPYTPDGETHGTLSKLITLHLD